MGIEAVLAEPQITHGGEYFVLVAADDLPDEKSPARVSPVIGRSVGGHELMIVDKVAVCTAAQQFARDVLNGVGYAELTFRRDAEDQETVRLVDFKLNALWFTDPEVAEFAQSKFSEDSFSAHIIAAVTSTSALVAYRAPLHTVVWNEIIGGYSMVASRDIEKDEVVFRDEARPVRLVTRPFVENTWRFDDQEVFSRYAWPIASDAHVYAIWDEDPRQWRPINHSCDPNLIFGANHSLNVIASRAIKQGEALTLDYAIFCDFTMAAFNCLCGAARCRGLITPDELSLSLYGTHSWHRTMPLNFKQSA